MKRLRHLSGRTRLLLTLELVVLPAAALIVFSVLHLKSIQRERSVEAAIQMDFQHMLAISEKRMNERLYDMADDVRHEFPCPTDGDVEAKLDQLLAKYPYAANVFVYDKGSDTVFRSQSGKLVDPDFKANAEKLARMITPWFDMEGSDLLGMMRKQQEKGDEPYHFFTDWSHRGDSLAYETIALFPIEAAPKGRTTIGGVVFDSDFLKQSFFPQMMNTLLEKNSAERESSHPTAVMMVRPGNKEFEHSKDAEPFAACMGWDGGYPEVERKLEGPFSGVTLGIKYRGTTIAAISRKFLRTSLLVLGGLSLLLAAGIFLTYRNVNKEMQLAKLKSDFVSNVSHELRTPLSLIRLYAETLELGRLPNAAKQHEYYQIIRKESERLTSLINNILDFSRIEAGRKEYDFRLTDVADLVRNTLDSYRYQIEQQGFTFKENISDDVPPMEVDREALARSLVNLLNNAIKYSEHDKYVGVNLYRSNGSVKLEVVDHGIGIPRGEQHKIFEKFYRSCDPLVHNTKGTGLGLSLVQHIVQAHGGEVEVDSFPGKGSKFTVVLPVNLHTTQAKAAAS